MILQKRNPRSGCNTARANSHRISKSIVSPADKLLENLDRVKSTGPGTWLASCPTSAHPHGDRSRGLSVREGEDGRVLIHCFGGCPVDDIVGAVGLQLADLFPPRPSEYPAQPRGRMVGRGRLPRIPWPDLFEALETDLRACSLAFLDLAGGKPFSPVDATTIARLSDHLANKISEVRHGR